MTKLVSMQCTVMTYSEVTDNVIISAINKLILRLIMINGAAENEVYG